MKRFLIIVFAVSGLWAQDNSGFTMLKLPGGVRMAGLNSTGTALGGDADMIYANPAGVLRASGSSVLFNLQQNLLDATHSSVAALFKNGKSAWFLDAEYLTIPGIEIRGDVPLDEPQGVTSAFNLALGVGYARYIDNWQLGVRVKYLFEKYYLATAPGWAVDVGLQYRNVAPGTDWGLVVQNAGAMSALDKVATPLPLTLRSGFTYRLFEDLFTDKLTLLPELIWVKGEGISYAMGLMARPLAAVEVVAGVRTRQETLSWSLGAGIRYEEFTVRYAYSQPASGLPGLNSFGLMFIF